jgi:riboflavin kinase/FMN adenylyltransferase
LARDELTQRNPLEPNSKAPAYPCRRDTAETAEAVMAHPNPALAFVGRRTAVSAPEWSIRGTVVRRVEFGHMLGHVAAELRIASGVAPPADGLYAGWLTTAHQIVPSVISVATGSGSGSQVQIQVPGCADLGPYDEEVSLTFVATLRDMAPLPEN